MLIDPRFRLAVRLLVGAVVIAPVLGVGRPNRRVPGTTFTLTSTSTRQGDGPMANAVRVLSNEWKANVLYAKGRGRMDIVEGAYQQMFAKGDYILFDTAEYIIVLPATKTFFAIPTDMAKRLKSMQRGMPAITMTLTDVVVAMDTVALAEDVGGQKTQHLRLTYSYTMNMDFSAMGAAAAGYSPPPTTSSAVSEYWFSADAHLPLTPLLSLGADMKPGDNPANAMFGGAMTELTNKMAVATAALPARTTLLKTRNVIRISAGPTTAGGTDNTIEVTGIANADVDLSRLVLPDGFTQVEMAGLAAIPGGDPLPPDGGAKWRKRP